MSTEDREVVAGIPRDKVASKAIVGNIVHSEDIPSYEVVKAKTAEEAIQNSSYFIGQKAVVARIRASANSGGTYSVLAEFELVEEKK